MFRHPRPATLLVALATGLAPVLGCLGPFPGAGPVSSPEGPEYAYFAAPEEDDAWGPKIAGWQSREREARATEGPGSPAEVSGPGAPAQAEGEPEGLRRKFQAFRREQKRETAREVAEWVQDTAREHYQPDGPIDHWATLEGTLERNGDDCDGLELLAYHSLRDLGFAEDEVFRAIVYRPSDGQHHMVTFWFEARGDPWVIDPTGAMTTGMPRMSEVPEWVPLKVFSETESYSVETAASLAHR